jgi:hypothetical protein
MSFLAIWRTRHHLTKLDQLIVAERNFPARMRPDLQRAFDDRFKSTTLSHFTGIQIERFTPSRGTLGASTGPHPLRTPL